MALNYLSLLNYAQPTATVQSLSVSSITGSSLIGSTVSGNAILNLSTFSGSTLTASTLLGSTVTTSRLGVSTLAGSTMTTGQIGVSSIQFNSTTLTLGQSTVMTQTNFSNGSYAAGSWVTAKSGLTNARKLATSSTGQYQLVVSGGTADLWWSADSGVTWVTLGASTGLPVLTGSAYWSAGSISADGQTILLAVYGGSLWLSADGGRTFALTKQATPDVWLPLNGSTTDVMGVSTVTATGSPGYVSVPQPGFVGQAVNLANTAGGTATRYVRGSWNRVPNFTFSFWFNAQSVNGTGQILFSSQSTITQIFINSTNNLYWQYPTNSGVAAIGTSYTITANTWYYVYAIFQTDGLCSFYVNNILIGSITNIGGFGSYSTNNLFSIGCYDTATTNAFNGYIADLRLYNSAVSYNPIPLLAPNVWLPFESSTLDLGSQSANSQGSTIYLPFEGSVADQMGVSTVTTPGTVPGYVAVNRAGYTGQAVNLVNTAGGTAQQYVRGTWNGATDFTVSFWFQPRTVGASNSQVIFSSHNTAFVIYIIGNTNQLRCYMVMQNGNTVTIGQSSALSVNTWYYISVIFQTNGACSIYVNNTLIGTETNVGGLNTPTTSFLLGAFNSNADLAFNGYIDDFRLSNYATTYNPVSIMTVTGSLSYVPGVVGLNAVSLVNPVGSTATNYINCSIPTGTSYTFSGWFNAQLAGTSIVPVRLANATDNLLSLMLYGSSLTVDYYTGSGVTTVGSVTISTNTWYHVLVSFTIGGTCLYYVNGQLIASGTVTALGGSINRVILGSNTIPASGGFNGYIDDFRIYNAVIPYHALAPQNYRAVALSGSSQYALASAASGWVLGSSTSGQTWSKQSVCVGTQGDVIQPNKTGVTSAQWEQNGVNWVSSASTELSGFGYFAYKAFNNTFSPPNTESWATSAGAYNGSGTYLGGQSTTVQGGIGTVLGEWLQIQSSVPLILQSYRFACNVPGQLPKNYYIVGSNNGSTWFPLQYVTGSVNPLTNNGTACSTAFLVNLTGTQTIQGDVLGLFTTTAYSASTTPYTYFRFIANTVWGGDGYYAFSELYLNFAKPSPSALSLSYSGQYQLVATGPAAGSIMPNQSGLASNTWTQGGVQWGATASSTYNASFYPYSAFDNVNSNVWASASIYNISTGLYTGSVSTSILGGIGSILGEWIQLQSSVPLVLQTYRFSAEAANGLPKTYYIIGSNDGSSWFPIQYMAMTTNPVNTNFNGFTTNVIVNYTGIQTIQGNVSGSGTSTAYSYTTQSWMYFRIICMTNYGNGTSAFGELYLNFSNSVSYSSNYGNTWLNTAGTVSNEIVSLSPSGQYALSTNAVAPLARLTLDNTNVDSQGVLTPATGAGTVTYSTSIVKVGTHSAFFNNTSPGLAPTMYLNYTVPAALNTPSVLTMACWVYPTSFSGTLVPIQLSAGTAAYSNGFYINTNGSVQFNYSTTTTASTGLLSTTVISINTWTHLAMTFSAGTIILYVNGVNVISASPGGLLSASGGGNLTNLLVGAGQASTYAFAGYVDDVRIYTSALSATAIASLYNNPSLTQAVGVSSSFLPIGGYITPTLPNVTANVVDARVSQTGQYMVLITSGVTNNVYYSVDYGFSFTGLTIGSSPMTACSMSYDGSYLTVTNGATVYTLNRNSTGYSVAMGSQAGQINQSGNAIAIGNKAGFLNQSANSIVLNATGSSLNTGASGFYVSPISVTAGLPMEVLGYGSDSQIVKTGVTILPGGQFQPLSIKGFYNSGYGTEAVLAITNGARSYTRFSPSLGQGAYNGAVQAGDFGIINEDANAGIGYPNAGIVIAGWNQVAGLRVGTTAVTMFGNVGIGTANPTSVLQLNGSGGAGAPLRIVSSSPGNEIGIGFFRNTDLSQTVNGDLWVMGMKSWDTDQRSFGIGCNGKAIVMSMLPSGNVGIGTTNPALKFTVYGPSTDIIYGGFNIFTGYSSYQPVVSCRLGWYSEYWDIAATRGPGTGVSDLMFIINGTNKALLSPNAEFCPSSDNVGTIGRNTNRWSAVWAVNGTIQTSDSHVKDSQPLPYGINEILQIRTIKYKWKSQADLPDDDPKKNFEYYGFCADELSPLFPELVYDEDTSAPVQMNYSELLPVVVNALKEEHASSVALKSVVDSQAEQISSLQSQLTATQSQLDTLLIWARAQGFSG